MALEDLAPLVGTWDTEAVFPAEWDAPAPDGEVVTSFEWTLGGAYLLERSTAPAPIPNGLCVIAALDDGTFTQHYFDSRGVTRTYAMTFDGTRWTLSRTAADFSPLDFQQRFEATVSADGDAIDGAWHICHDGTTWQQDFELRYRRR